MAIRDAESPLPAPVVGWSLKLVSPQSSAGSLGECHRLGKLPQHDPLAALSLHHLGEAPTAGLETKLYRKIGIKVESSIILWLGGEGGEGRAMLLCHCDALHPQAHPKTELTPTLGSLDHLPLALSVADTVLVPVCEQMWGWGCI